MSHNGNNNETLYSIVVGRQLLHDRLFVRISYVASSAEHEPYSTGRYSSAPGTRRGGERERHRKLDFPWQYVLPRRKGLAAVVVVQ